MKTKLLFFSLLALAPALPAPAAQITQQPASVDIRVRPDTGVPCCGDVAPNTNAAIILVATTSQPPLTFQWRMNGTNLLPSPHYSNVNAATLIISNVTVEDFGNYSCVVTDLFGINVSSNAMLYPLVRPTILFPSLNQTQTVVAGRPFPVSAVLSNGWPPPFGYIWRRNPFTSVPIIVSDSKTNFFVFPESTVGTNAVTGASYYLYVTNRAHPAPGNPPVNPRQFYVTTLLDTDNDGIPDTVESALGLGTNNTPDALFDLDGDGMSNLAEYQAGTDPGNSNSFLRIEHTIIPGTASVSFTAVSNRTYTIQFSESFLAESWSTLADFVALPTNRVEVAIDPGWTSNRFYRLVTPRQP